MDRVTLARILAIKDPRSLCALLLIYAGQRIHRAECLFGPDSKQYQDALERWTAIVRSHVDNARRQAEERTSA